MAKKITVVILLILISLAIFFDISQYFTLEEIKNQQANIILLYEQNPQLIFFGFFLLYVIVAAFSIPGAALLTLLAGSLFGLFWGSLVVSFASTIGASIAFLIARYLFRDYIQENYKDKLTTMNQGIEKDGGYYLFTLRLVPIFPFFVINLLMGVTTLPLSIYYIVSQIGMLPATIIYVNAGKQLASIDSLSGILSPNILFAFVLLGLFPLIVKKAVDFFSKKPTTTTD